LQDANRPLIEELTQLHDFINLVLIFVLRFVGVIIVLMVMGKHINQNLLEMFRNADSRVGLDSYSCRATTSNCFTLITSFVYVG